MRLAKRICALAVWACAFAVVSPSATAAEATAEQIQAWVKQLGNEDFQKREEARDALLKAGMSAMAALKEAQKSEDNEVRNAASLLVSQMQWLAVPRQMDYMRLFPAETLFAAHIRDIAALRKGTMQTTLLKFIDNEDFKPLKDLLVARAEKEMGPALPMLQKWTDHFSGQMAGAVWALNPMDPKGMRMALVAELKADALDKIFQEFLAETGVMKNAVPTPLNGLTIMSGPNDMGAIALVGNHVVLGPNLESVRIIAENMLEPPADGLTTKPAFNKALSTLGSAPDFTFAMDFQQYLKFIAGIGPEGPKMAEMMNKLGYDGMDIFLMTTRLIGDRFEDRFTVTMNGKPSKLMDLMATFSNAEIDMKKAFSAIPAEAAITGNSYLDGAATYQFIMSWVKEMIAIENRVKPEEVDKGIADFEQMTGIKLADLTGTIKGDVGYWVELAPALAPPHLGFYVQCPDAAKADALAGYIGQYLEVAARMVPPPKADDEMQAVPAPAEEKAEAPKAEEKPEAKPAEPAPAEKTEPAAEPKAEGQDQGQPAKPPAPASQKMEYKGHSIFTESPESPLVMTPGREVVPYRLTWAVHNDRVFFTSSVVQMEKRLTALDAGAPGFDPTKVLPANAPDATQIKAMMIVDVKRLLDYGAKFGLPLVTPLVGKDKEIQMQLSRLGELAAERSLFEGLPPIVAAGLPVKDGVQSTVMWTPTPYLPTVFVGAAGAGLMIPRMAGRRGGAMQPPAPPPNVNF